VHTDSFGQQTDNAAKYTQRRGLERRLLSRFRTRMLAELRPLHPASILDAGCGEGYVTEWLARAFETTETTAVDGRADALAALTDRSPNIHVVESDLSALPFADDSFELVVCTEVLEHVREPSAVLRELARVSAPYLFITVPHEPFFRIGNLAAGRYVSRLGSTPGHAWTWSARDFRRLVGAEADPVRWVSLFPWQGVLARSRR
jgi:2-polyprenyl-3-methyl-5-hydroxy-6-metoxy-1,4-benzoquinol methylase